MIDLPSSAQLKFDADGFVVVDKLIETARLPALHQDSAYLDWLTPSDLLTCWIALDDTSADGGTIEFVRGSHKWRLGDNRLDENYFPILWREDGYRTPQIDEYLDGSTET